MLKINPCEEKSKSLTINMYDTGTIMIQCETSMIETFGFDKLQQWKGHVTNLTNNTIISQTPETHVSVHDTPQKGLQTHKQYESPLTIGNRTPIPGKPVRTTPSTIVSTPQTTPGDKNKVKSKLLASFQYLLASFQRVTKLEDELITVREERL